MDLDRIKSMPIQKIVEDNAALMMWTTGPYLPFAFDVATAWGFKNYSTMLFVWIKTNPSICEGAIINPETDVKQGLGYWTASNAEIALLFTRGKNPPSKVGTGVKQVLHSPVKEHSEKPLTFHDRFEKLMGEGTYLDLFARRYRRNWTCLGDELDGMDIYDSIEKLASLDLPYIPKGVREPLEDSKFVKDWQMQLRPEPLSGKQMRLAI